MSDYKKVKCPCCGSLEIPEGEEGLYHICSNCFWECDPIQNDKPDYSGGANCHSLNEYRKEFERKKKENPDFCCRNEQDKKYMIEWDHSK